MDSKEHLEENKTSKETKLFEISIQNINYELELTKSENNKYILFKLSPKNNNIKYYILKLNLIQFKYIHSFFSFYNDINEIYDLLSNSLNNKKYTISFKDNICIVIFKFEMPGNKIINIDFNLKEIYENSLAENIYKEINNLKEENKNIKDELNKKNKELIEIKNDIINIKNENELIKEKIKFIEEKINNKDNIKEISLIEENNKEKNSVRNISLDNSFNSTQKNNNNYIGQKRKKNKNKNKYYNNNNHAFRGNNNFRGKNNIYRGNPKGNNMGYMFNKERANFDVWSNPDNNNNDDINKKEDISIDKKDNSDNWNIKEDDDWGSKENDWN